MALRTSINRKNYIPEDDDDDDDGENHHTQTNEYDEEIDETEGDLIENYLYLTQRCGILRHSTTASTLDTMQRQQQQSMFSRQFSLETENHNTDLERSLYSTVHRSSSNDFNNNYHHPTNYSMTSRVPPTIYYNNDEDDFGERSFSLVKIFARIKTRLKHDRRYRAQSTHVLLDEEDSQEWIELAKNTRDILTKALLPDGGYDVLVRQPKTRPSRQSSQKNSRDYAPVLLKEIEDDEAKINFHIDDEFNTEGDQEFDEIIRNKFLKCPRGFRYRRFGVCKAVDRQHFQGQLVYVYGVANNILIDENLKASGLG